MEKTLKLILSLLLTTPIIASCAPDVVVITGPDETPVETLDCDTVVADPVPIEPVEPVDPVEPVAEVHGVWVVLECELDQTTGSDCTSTPRCDGAYSLTDRSSGIEVVSSWLVKDESHHGVVLTLPVEPFANRLECLDVAGDRVSWWRVSMVSTI